MYWGGRQGPTCFVCLSAGPGWRAGRDGTGCKWGLCRWAVPRAPAGGGGVVCLGLA